MSAIHPKMAYLIGLLSLMRDEMNCLVRTRDRRPGGLQKHISWYALAQFEDEVNCLLNSDATLREIVEATSKRAFEDFNRSGA